MEWKWIRLLSLLIFTTSSLSAQKQTYVFNLQQCIDYAYKNQVDVKNASIDKDIAKYKVRETTAIGLPQIQATSTFNHFIDIPTQLVPGQFFGDTSGRFIPVQFGVANTLGYGAEVSQIIFSGSYLVGLQAAKVYGELSAKSLDRSKIETNVSVSKAYYGVLINRERILLLDANIERLNKNLIEVRALNQNGFVKKIDLNRTELIYNNLKTERENTQRLIDLSLNLLKFQMGMPVAENLIVNEKISEINFQPNLEIGDTTNYENRIEYSLLKTQVKLNELNNKLNKSANLPTLVAFGSYSQNIQTNNFNKIFSSETPSFPTTIIGLSLNVPIFSSGKRYYKTEQSKLEILKSNNTLNNFKNVVDLETQSSKTNYTNSIQSLDNQKKNMALADEIVKVTRIKYEQGIGSSLEVTNAETELKTAQNNYLSAMYDTLITKIDLEKAKGNIK